MYLPDRRRALAHGRRDPLRSDPEPELERELASIGVGWKVVPQTGHPMGLQNPAGLAQTVAEIVAASWQG